MRLDNLLAGTATEELVAHLRDLIAKEESELERKLTFFQEELRKARDRGEEEALSMRMAEERRRHAAAIAPSRAMLDRVLGAIAATQALAPVNVIPHPCTPATALSAFHSPA